MNVTSGLILITIAIYELIMYIYRTMESRYKVKAGKSCYLDVSQCAPRGRTQINSVSA